MAEPIGVVFDLDGTLMDSAPDIHRATLEVLSQVGLQPIDFTTLRSFIGNGVPTLLARVLASQGQPTDSAIYRDMLARFPKIYEESYDNTTLFPNVLPMLQALRTAGFPMAICTNKAEALTLAVLRHFDLLQFFPVIVGGDTLPQRKPDPEPLRHAMRGLAVQNCVFVGDSEVDEATALAAEVPFALFTGGYRKKAPEAFVSAILFDDHADFKPRLRAMLKP